MLQIAVSIATHLQDLPDLTHSARYEETPGASKEAMIAKWQEWLQAAGMLCSACRNLRRLSGNPELRAALQDREHSPTFVPSNQFYTPSLFMLGVLRNYGYAVNETGGVPPGNAKGDTTWSIRRSAPKPELKLTPGKGIQDLTCSVEDLVDQVVKSNKVLEWSSCEYECPASSAIGGLLAGPVAPQTCNAVCVGIACPDNCTWEGVKA